MQTHRLVKEALKAKAPQLHQQLADQGALTQYALDLAEQINSQVVTMTQADRASGKWDNLGPMECAARMKMADALNQETVLAEMQQFPQDETSLQKQH